MVLINATSTSMGSSRGGRRRAPRRGARAAVVVEDGPEAGIVVEQELTLRERQPARTRVELLDEVLQIDRRPRRRRRSVRGRRQTQVLDRILAEESVEVLRGIALRGGAPVAVVERAEARHGRREIEPARRGRRMLQRLVEPDG